MSVHDKVKDKIMCYHCGDICPDDSISIDDKYFCCNGCKTVYELLDENQLCNYYKIDNSPGAPPDGSSGNRFEYLDDEDVKNQLIDFKDEKITSVTFYIPQMHCSSCIYLLENLHKLNYGVLQSRVDFLKKKASINFNHNKISLKELVQLLSSIGYLPRINFDTTEKKEEIHANKNLYYKIGVAGFCFGNIMLLSFPEYLSLDFTGTFFSKFFGYLNLLLALPVFLYSSSEYFISALKGLKKKIINIDVPIALGILVLFLRSSYEVLSHTGAGYFDSLAGLVFFLLIGKLFQAKTYDSLNFERNYKSYFPLAVSVKRNDEEKSIPISKLQIGDRILIRNDEIIPADAILFKGDGNIDYSFVTGESKPVQKVMGELIYAGGRQSGSAIELEVVKEVSQSYLTQLWNNDTFLKKTEGYFTQFSNTVSKYFTIIILLIAFVSAAFWFPVNSDTALNVLTAVLIVACPCALALSVPFTFGNALRIYGKNKLYLKNTDVIEEMSNVNEIVFDKTGTITQTGDAEVKFVGKELNDFQKEMIKAVVKNSTHPLSKIIYDSLDVNQQLDITEYDEIHGKGVYAKIFGNEIKLGSQSFMESKEFDFNSEKEKLFNSGTRIYLSINNEVTGYFEITNKYREGISSVIELLGDEYKLSLLSGDNEGEKKNLIKFFNKENKLYFRQSPQDKLNYIKNLQNKNKKVLMIGDGLNDAGALSQSDVGIAVTENISNFSPACDGILEGSKLYKLKRFLDYAKTSRKIIYLSFTISFMYNFIGLGFAVQGLLSPIVAAILMPVSSISVVLFASLSTNFMAKKRGLLSL